MLLVVADAFAQNAIDAICLRVKAVVAVFAMDNGKCDDTTCQSDSQAQKVDESVEFVAQEIAQSDGEVVGKHKSCRGAGEIFASPLLKLRFLRAFGFYIDCV